MNKQLELEFLEKIICLRLQGFEEHYYWLLNNYCLAKFFEFVEEMEKAK